LTVAVAAEPAGTAAYPPLVVPPSMLNVPTPVRVNTQAGLSVGVAAVPASTAIEPTVAAPAVAGAKS